MKIVDVCARPVKACLTFEHKGLIVSASTIFPNSSVMVLQRFDGKFASDKNFNSIPAALAWINRNHKRFD